MQNCPTINNGKFQKLNIQILKIHVLINIGICLAIINNVFILTYCQNSIPLTYSKSVYFESGSFYLTQQPATPNTFSTNITFNTVFSSPPEVIIAFDDINYNLNLKTPVGNHQLNLKLTASMITLYDFMAIGRVQYSNLLKSISISYLAIDPNFPFFNFIQINTISYVNNSTKNISTSTSLNVMNIYLTRLNVQISQADGHKFDISWIINQVSSILVEISLNSSMTSFKFLEIDITVLFIYHHDIPKQIYTFTQRTFTNSLVSSTASHSLTSYIQGKSILFYGLRNFIYNCNQVSTSDNFRITFNQTSNNTYSHYKTSYFSQTGYNGFIMNQIKCDNYLYPFQKYNSIKNEYECYEYCASNQYQFLTVDNVRVCRTCSGNCLRCKSSTNCYECKENYDLLMNFTCRLNNKYAINSGIVTLCSTLMKGCTNCSDNTTCIKCEQTKYKLLGSNCISCSNAYDINCVQCDMNYCLACKPGYKIINGTNCSNSSVNSGYLTCSNTNCKICNQSKLSECFLCSDDQIQPTNGICMQICGDGKIMGVQECDDQNIYSNDGCSSNCKLQKNYLCEQNAFNPSSKYYKSQCFFNAQLKYQVVYIQKIQKINRVQIKLKIYPFLNQIIWDSLNIDSILSISNEITQKIKVYKIFKSKLKQNKDKLTRLLQASQSENQRNIYIYLDYNQSIDNEKLQISLNPTLSGLSTLSRALSYNSSFQIISRNNHIINVYTQNVYEKSFILDNLSLILGFMTFFLIVTAIFSGNMNIIIELSGIIQLGYFGLLGIGKLNPMFHSLTQLKCSSGINPSFFYNYPAEDQFNSRVFIGIQMYSQFHNNANLSIFLILLCLAFGFILKLIRKVISINKQNSIKIQQYQNRILGSAPLYLVICFSYLISISFNINVYCLPNDALGYIFSILSLFIIIALIILFIKLDIDHVIFKDLTIKMNENKKIYILLTLVSRFIIGILLVSLHSYFIQPILIISILLIQTILFLTKFQIFTQSRKFLFILNKLIVLLILSIYFSTRIIYQNIQENNLIIYLSFSVIIILYITFVINFTFYFYSIKLLRCCQLRLRQQRLFNDKLLKKKENNTPSLTINKDQQQNNIRKDAIIEQIEKKKLKKPKIIKQLQININEIQFQLFKSCQRPFSKFHNNLISPLYQQPLSNKNIQKQVRKQIKNQLENSLINHKSILKNGNTKSLIKLSTRNKNKKFQNNQVLLQNKQFQFSNIYQQNSFNSNSNEFSFRHQQIQEQDYVYQYTNPNLYVTAQQYSKI